MNRILVVEDDPQNRKLIRQRLEKDYEIIETGDPTEALGLALSGKPDCILLDLMMPRFSGLELCQTFASVSNTQTIPIFVITGRSAEEHKEFCLNLGARDFFQKPIDFDKLKSALNKLLKTPVRERRSEPRIRLKVILKIAGIHSTGKQFELLTSTEDVSSRGFLCRCSLALESNCIVQVSLLSRNGESYVGTAELRHVQWLGLPWQTCGFEFADKPGQWVL